MPTNFVWKAVYTESLFQYLSQAIENGERGNKCKVATTYISQLYDVHVTKENVANHLRTWKAKWNRICRLKKLSGVSWDDDQKMIIMGDLEAHPDCDGLLNRPLQYYTELATICGNDVAVGDFAVQEVGQRFHGFGGEEVDPSSNSRATSDRMSISMQSKGKSVAGPSRSSKAGGSTVVTNLFANSLAKLAGAMQSKNDEEQNLADRIYSALHELLGETYGCMTFELGHVLWANDYLLERTKIAWGFLRKPIEERKAWLHRLLLSDAYRE